MNIDERLEKLAERHEALAQSVELMIREHRDFQHETKEFQQRMTQYSADVKDAFARLANIAAVHNECPDDHQERLDKLES